MKDDAPVELDPLVGGLTRPPMMIGVPYILVVIESMIVLTIFIVSGNLLNFLIVVPLHGLAYWLTIFDARYADIILIRVRKCLPTWNRAFWGGNSYSP